MTSRTSAWPWGVRSVVAVAIVLLWWWTAGADRESALWRHYSATTALMNVLVSALLVSVGYVVAAPDSHRPRLFRTILVAASVLLTVGVLELAAVLGHDYGRTLGVHEDDTWLQLALGVNRRDPELIHLHQPHTRYQGRVTGNLARLGLPAIWHEVDVTYDRHGFRNAEDFTQADVVAIGDSFVEGAEVAADRTVVAELSRRLATPVANLGQSNYGPQQELVVLQRYGLPLAPRVVVWFFFGGNDLRDVDTYERLRAHPEPLHQPLTSRLFTRNVLRAIAKLTTPDRRTPSAEARRHAFEFVRSDKTVEVQYLDVPERPWEPRQWDVASATLARAHELTRQKGADFLVVYIPRKLRVYRDYLRAAPGSLAHSWPMNDLPDVMAAWCRDRSIAFLDATVSLRAAVATGESVHLPDDVHWNPAGHRVVGTAVAERISTMGSLTVRQARGER